MSIEYDEYLYEHMAHVINGFEWLQQNIPELVSILTLQQINRIITRHDESKNYREEYCAYDDYFYGGKKTKEVNEKFNYAWLHHIRNNPHHWQYWVLVNDDPEEGTVALDIPYEYVIEMICDWWAFSWRNGDLYEIFKWYDEHKDYMVLSKNTRELVEEILGKIRSKLDEINENHIRIKVIS